MREVLIMGCSGHAKVIIDIVEKEARFRIAGLIDTFRKDTVLGYPVLGTESDLPKLFAERQLDGVIVAIGDNATRAAAVARISQICPQLPFVSATHPCAVVGRDVTIGVGTVLMAGVVVNPSSRIGSHCILNTRSSLDHDSVMGDFSSLAPGVTTGGNCKIGDYTAIGLGAAISHGVTVAEHCVIGSNSLVLHNVNPFSVIYGTPARTIRTRQKGERYL